MQHHADIRDHDVDRAGSGDRGRGRADRGDEREVDEARLDRPRQALTCRDEVIELCRIAGEGDHLRAASGRTQGDRTTNAARGSRDDPSLPIEAEAVPIRLRDAARVAEAREVAEEAGVEGEGGDVLEHADKPATPHRKAP